MKRNALLFAFSLVFCCWQLLLAQNNENQLASKKSEDNVYNLTEDVIQQRIEMYLLKNYHDNHKQVVIECDPFKAPIPVDPVDWEIKVDSRFSPIKNGTNLVEVTVFSNKEIYKKFNVVARIRTFDDIVVASRILQREEKIPEDAVELQELETTKYKRDYFTTLKDVVGLQTTHIINPGNPIFTRSVELPDIIFRGNFVKIIVKLKNMEVKATGVALQNGKRGELIRVQNKSTGKKLVGEVVDEKTVIVEL